MCWLVSGLSFLLALRGSESGPAYMAPSTVSNAQRHAKDIKVFIQPEEECQIFDTDCAHAGGVSK